MAGAGKELLVPFLFLFLVFYTIHGCPCIRFNTSGVFHSPNYPATFDPVPCLLYHFEAPINQRILLTFESFSLPSRSSKCESYVRVYDSSEDGLVDLDGGYSDGGYSDEWCGEEGRGVVVPSLHRHLILYIHTADTSSGFSGKHSFVPIDKYKSDAVQVSEWTYRVEGTRGTIFSPLFPFYAPDNVNVTYIFPSRTDSELLLTSFIVELPDGWSLEAVDNQGHVLALADNTSSSFRASSSASVRVSLRTGVRRVRRGRMQIDFSYSSGASQTSSACTHTITSKAGSYGNLSSFSLTSSNSQPLKCLIIFQGEADQRVSIRFKYFKLSGSSSSKWVIVLLIVSRCVDGDVVSVDVLVGFRLMRVSEWCGTNTPPPIMASTNLLHLQYSTKSSRHLREMSHFGFDMEYAFHSDWAMERMNAKWDRSKVCRFVFDSSMATHGELWNINYPGLYPRGVTCEYVFHGKEDETVHISFDYFDIEGFNQCDSSSRSDYVLFSNYQTHDRTNRRFCGQVSPRPILSESNYFRLIFATNEVFDGTGFYAKYQFLKPRKAGLSRIKQVSSSATSSLFLAASPLAIPLLCLYT